MLTAYQSQGFLEVTGDPATAESVVFLAGTPYTEVTRSNAMPRC